MNLSDFRTLFGRHGLLAAPSLAPNGDLPADRPISAIGCDSRTVTPGTLFFCKGVNFRPEYLTEAIARGACAYVAENELDTDLPHILVRDLRRAMPIAAHEFYGAPERTVPLVGITGTKGKTSCACQLAGIFAAAYGERYGMIATHGAFSCGKERKKSGTTPEALDFYALLDDFAKSGARAAVTEVSSQGLQYDRVYGVEFRIGIWLNLSPDHISPTEHKNFDEYKAAKKKMLTLCKTGILNLDDPWAEETRAAARCETLKTVSLHDTTADYYAKNVEQTEDGTAFTVCGTDLDGERLTLKMAGEFNVTNALCAVAAARELGIGIDEIRRGLSTVTVKGRMEKFTLGGVNVIVDYAHNGLSFEKIFDFADRFFPDARKIVVYGCPGNKAYDRREEMSDVAGRRADQIVLTDDDPADEDPDAIWTEAEQPLIRHGADYIKIHDRRDAIAAALRLCKEGDLLLLLGKGHETGQTVHGKSEYYGGDRVVAETVFRTETATV